MHPMTEQAQAAIAMPEVQEMLKKLSEYGLGIFMPHMHHPDSGEFAPLPPGIVSVERGLQVSFHDIGSQEVAQSQPVGWVWDKGTQAAMNCAVCYEFSGQHSKGSC